MDRAKEEVIEGDCTPWMDRTAVLKQEPAWSMEEDSPDQPSAVYSTEQPSAVYSTEQPSAVYSTVQPMSNNTSASLLSPKDECMCQRCSAAFVLVSSLELHLASVHGDFLPFPEWTESSLMSSPHGRLSTEETDHVRNYSADSVTEFVLKLEPPWSMEEDSPDQPSAVYSSEQPMSDNNSASLLSLKRGRVCQRCSATFVLVSRLELHLASVHGEELHMVLPGSSTPDRCDAGNCSGKDIDKEVPSHSNRKMTTNKGDDDGDQDGKNRRLYVCDICRKVFHSPSKLKTHRLIHSGVKAFVCDVCSKSFKQASHLKIHKMTHSGHKPFVCEVCSISFTQSGDLTKHKRIHTGERPYKCPHCEKDFNRSGNLQQHIKSVHDGIKPHVCDVCGAAFSQPGDLTKHRRIHTGQKAHVCSECGKGFADPRTFRKHVLIHAGHKPHNCPHCPAAFIRLDHLKKHTRSTHQ